MRDENNSTKWIIITLIIVILLLIGVIAYSFWLKPSYQEFVLGKQQEAYNLGLIDSQRAILAGIESSIVQFGYVQITFEDNQTVYLAPFNPQQTDLGETTPLV